MILRTKRNATVVCKRPLTVGWSLLSPITALSLSLAVAAISVLFPSSYYERIVGEQSYIYHNLRVALYIAVCTSAFLVGFVFHKYILSARLKSPIQREQTPGNQLSSALLLATLLSSVFITLNIYALFVLYNAIPVSTVVSALLGDVSSTTLRVSVAEIFADQNLGVSLAASAALVPWLTLVILRMSPSARKTPTGALAITLISALSLLIVVNAVLMQGRSHLLYPVFAAFIVWCAVRIEQDRLKLKALLPAGVTVLVIAMIYFTFVAITRQGSTEGGIGSVSEQLVGYFVGSYNRFAAMMEGVFVLPGTGGYYWTQGIWEMPFVSSLMDLQGVALSLFGAVGPSQWEEVYPYVSSAGLESNLTALTIFSHTYADFGWFGFMPFIVYGFVSRLAWVAFRNGSTWAVIIYPYILWSIVEWRGYIEIARASGIDTLIFLAVAVSVGQSLMRSYVASTGHVRKPETSSGRIRWRRST